MATMSPPLRHESGFAELESNEQSMNDAAQADKREITDLNASLRSMQAVISDRDERMEEDYNNIRDLAHDAERLKAREKEAVRCLQYVRDVEDDKPLSPYEWRCINRFLDKHKERSEA